VLPVHAYLKESRATGHHTRCPDANPVPQAAQHLLGHLSPVYSQLQAVQPGRKDGRCELSVDEATNSGRHGGRLNTGGVVQRSRRLQLCRTDTSFTDLITYVRYKLRKVRNSLKDRSKTFLKAVTNLSPVAKAFGAHIVTGINQSGDKKNLSPVSLSPEAETHEMSAKSMCIFEDEKETKYNDHRQRRN
jgi:hypothetical protein